MTHKILFYFLFTLTLIGFSNCKPDEPVVIQPKEKNCEHCKMSIVDMRFDSQFVTKKGKRYFFDSIECMGHYINEKPIETHKIWVKDYSNSKSFTEAEASHFLKSKKIISPMGENLSAYSSLEDRSKFKTDMTDLEMNWQEVLKFLSKSSPK
jgi:copper chaperone NosL